MKPIYEPKGKAKEYGDYALNIYTGCPHRCYYCFAPSVLHKSREEFHSHVEPRPGIVEAVRKQLENERITDKLIHLCFTCDPYPRGYDSTVTREIIKLLKYYKNHIQILTKGGKEAIRDFDLLDSGDWFGVTITGDFWNDKKSEPNAASWFENLETMAAAHDKQIHTWVSCEPVLDADNICRLLSGDWPVDRFKIGKLNYHPSNINWHDFGHEAERLCKQFGRDYYIKEDLRREMD
jgi:DNA repair photolyase